LFPDRGDQQIDSCCDGHAVPNQVQRTIRDEFAKDGGEPPQKHRAMKSNKGFGAGRSVGWHTLLKNQGR
jgi:hypothetical protein